MKYIFTADITEAAKWYQNYEIDLSKHKIYENENKLICDIKMDFIKYHKYAFPRVRVFIANINDLTNKIEKITINDIYVKAERVGTLGGNNNGLQRNDEKASR